jgi:hypothetical protein
VVPKHRRSEFDALLPSAGVNTADFLPEAVGYGQATATATAWPPVSHSSVGPSGNGYPESNGYDGPGAGADWSGQDEQSWQDWQDWQDWGPPPAMHPDHPSAPVPRVQFPADHPSRPMPAVRPQSERDLPQRRPGGSARTFNPRPQRPDAAHGDGGRRLYAVPDDPSAVDYGATAPPADFYRQPGPAPRDVNGYQRQPGRGRQEPAEYRRESAGYRRQPGPGWQEATDYRRETGPTGPGSGPAGGRFKDFRSSTRDSLRPSGQVLEIHHGQDREFGQFARPDGRQFAQEAQDYAASIREAAEREAAAITQDATNRADVITQQATGQADAIRETAQREAAELRARLDSMSGELSRVTAYLTENLAAPSPMPAAAPVLPDAMPDLGTSPAPPDTRPGVRPDTRPGMRPDTRPGMRPDTRPGMRPDTRPGMRPDTGLARPETRPGTRPARPTAPDTRPGRPDGPPKPKTTPAKMPQTLGRQRRAMRIATAGTAALLSVAAIGAVTMTSIHGFSFFVFRESGQGETPGTFTDANFLAGQKECFVSGVAADGTPNGSSDRIPAPCATAPAVQHHDSTPKGRHHKATASK